jgi:heat shock protein HslJ
MTAGGDWEVVAMVGPGAHLAPVMPGTKLTLEIGDDGAVSGFGGCNRFFGGIGGGSPQPLGRTMMAGPPEVMAQEDTYLALLERADQLVAVGSDLEAREGDTTLVHFKPIDREIRGVTWALTGIHNGKEGFSSVLGDVVVTIHLDDEGRASGSSGCNRYTASYTLSGPDLEFGAPSGTRMACPAPVMAQEALYLGWLPEVRSHRVSMGASGRSLHLEGDDARGLLEFVESQ